MAKYRTAEGSYKTGKKVTYYDGMGNKIVKDGGDLNWRTNNPGNLTAGTVEAKRNSIGTYLNRVDGKEYKMAIFPDMGTGEKAMKEYIKRKYGEQTIKEMMEKYAPPKDNDTERYIRIIQKATGLDPDKTKISTLSSDEFERLISAMKTHEGTKTGDVIGSTGDSSNIFDKANDFITDVAKTVINSINSRLNDNGSSTYTVQKGDTLAKIAKKYGLTVAQLKRLNPNLRNGGNLLSVGGKINLGASLRGGNNSGYGKKSQSDVRGANKKNRVDPLVLDLDGDGVELIDIDKSNAMFDLDGDGFAKKTGWVGKDDGLLVLDKNNDGMVNDINELFGNKNQSGFAALSIYDTNHDGKIDSFDDVFKNLKVWQDANGDGSTQAEELKALTDYQIAAINLQNQRAATANDDGSRVTDTGSFTKQDGTTGTVGDVEFELDRLYSYYNKEVTLDPRIIDLPWIKGYGYMPDLPIAMSLDSALLEQVQSLMQETDPAKLKEGFEKIIFKWAKVEDITAEQLGASWRIRIDTDVENRLFHFDDNITLSFEQVGAVQKFTGEIENTIGHAGGSSLQSAWNTMYTGLFARFAVEAGIVADILPNTTYDFFTDTIDIEENASSPALKEQIKGMLLTGDTTAVCTALSAYMIIEQCGIYTIRDMLIETTNIDQLSRVLEVINTTPFGLVIDSDTRQYWFGTEGNDSLIYATNATVLKGFDGNDYLTASGADNIIFGDSGDDSLYGGEGDDILDGGTGNDLLRGEANNDTYIFGRGSGQDVIDGYGNLPGNTDIVEMAGPLVAGDLTLKRSGNDLIISIKDTEDRLTLNGQFTAADTTGRYKITEIRFADGTVIDAAGMIEAASQLTGTSSNDVIYGYEWNDKISGLDGDDLLYGDVGDDTLDGGAGNDTMYGEYGNDTYKFGIGSGNDKLFETGGEADAIEFGEGLTLEDVEFTKSENNLFIALKDGNDSLSILDWFSNPDREIELFEFKDGTTLTTEDIDAMGLATADYNQIHFTSGDDYENATNDNDEIFGYEGDDNLYGLNGNDIIHGGPGDDFLSGWAGDDKFYGDSGDDTLYGGPGNDTLDGETGDDILRAGMGDDVYLFGRGSGNDTIYSWEWEWGVGDISGTDTVRFKAGLSPESIEYIKDGDSLVLKIKDTGETLTLAYWFWGGVYRVENFRFEDGTVFSSDEIESRGYNIYGTNDSDYIEANEGNDMISAGAGNDYISDYSGSDTYIFNSGDGQDTINENDYNGTDNDTVRFGEAIAKEDVVISRQGYNLVTDIKNTTDQIIIENWFDPEANHKIERFEFANGAVLESSEIDANPEYRIIKGTAGDDYFSGMQGDDIFNACKGNDYLEGGAGEDTYIFDSADGKDIINETASDYEMDTLRLGSSFNRNGVGILQDGGDLYVLADGNNYVRINGQFEGEPTGIERIEANDGYYISRQDIENIVNAMVDFNSDSGMDIIQRYSNQAVNQQYLAVLSQSWQQPLSYNMGG